MNEDFKLKSVEFRREREENWTELEELLTRIEKNGLQSLSANEVSRLPMLYRATLSSLSVARAISLDRNLIEYLEKLSARGYINVYGAHRKMREALGDFFFFQFPAHVRRFRWHILISAVLLLLGGLVGAVMTLQDPELFYTFVSPEYAGDRGPQASTESLRAALFDDGGGEMDSLAFFSTYLMTHNAKIGMMAFALGFACLPVIYLLFYNGLLLGSFAALYHGRDLGFEFWSWILPHGITEVFAVILCGGAGLMVAEAVVFPGKYSRRAMLAKRGRQAGVIVLGAVVLFVLAGFIEGFFRQMVQNIPLRYGVAVATAMLWAAYFKLMGADGRRI